MKVKRQVEYGMVRICEMEDGSVKIGVRVPTADGMQWRYSAYMDDNDLWEAFCLFTNKS